MRQIKVEPAKKKKKNDKHLYLIRNSVYLVILSVCVYLINKNWKKWLKNIFLESPIARICAK